MSNILPLCPCLDSQDKRLKCFKKAVENNAPNCSQELLEKYNEIIDNIKSIFDSSIEAINQIEQSKFESVSEDYVSESEPMFEVFQDAINGYIEYKEQLNIDPEYRNIQKCFYNNCNSEIEEQMRKYQDFVDVFQNFLRQKETEQPSNELEDRHNKLIIEVVNSIIDLYKDEINEYRQTYLSVSPKREGKKDNFKGKPTEIQANDLTEEQQQFSLGMFNYGNKDITQGRGQDEEQERERDEEQGRGQDEEQVREQDEETGDVVSRNLGDKKKKRKKTTKKTESGNDVRSRNLGEKKTKRKKGKKVNNSGDDIFEESGKEIEDNDGKKITRIDSEEQDFELSEDNAPIKGSKIKSKRMKKKTKKDADFEEVEQQDEDDKQKDENDSDKLTTISSSPEEEDDVFEQVDPDIEEEKLDCNEEDTGNCILHSNCSSSSENLSDPCECINDKAKNIDSAKKACKLLKSKCDFTNKCIKKKKKKKKTFSQNNFCENISKANKEINGKKSDCKDSETSKKFIKTAVKSSKTLYGKDEKKKICPKISYNFETECEKILKDGEKCCEQYFKDKEEYIKSIQKGGNKYKKYSRKNRKISNKIDKNYIKKKITKNKRIFYKKKTIKRI